MLEEIEAGLGSGDPEERRRATARLADAAPDAGGPLLVRALGDDDWRVRKQATEAAIALAPAPEIVSALIEALAPSPNVGLRNAAVEALAGFGVPAVDALGVAIFSLDADGRKLAAEALGRSAQPAALATLSRLVSDKDVNVRGAAIEAVAQIGSTCLDDAANVLEKCLDSGDRFLRLAALNGINQLRLLLPWERVEPLLGDPVLERAALLAAARGGHERAAAFLASALERARGAGWRAALEAFVDYVHSGPSACESARRALGSLPAPARQKLIDQARAEGADQLEARRPALLLVGLVADERAASAAIAALGDDRLAGEAEEALALLGDAAVAALVSRARSGEADQRVLCIETLGRLANEAHNSAVLEALRRALGDESLDVVRAALAALATLGDEGSMRPTAEWLRRDAPVRVRQAAAVALGAMAGRHPETSRQLAREASPDGPDALAAAVVIGSLGEPARGSVELDVQFLSAALSHESTMVRRAALDALSELPSALSVDAVAFALSDEERDVQLAAVRALGKLRAEDGGAAGVDQLLALVQRSGDEGLVAAAIRALGAAGDGRALGVLRPLARGGEPVVAVAAVDALGRLEDARRVDALIEAASHPDAEVVKAALRVLAGEREPRVGAHLGVCLDHEAWDVRRLAADLLAGIGGETGARILRAKLASESEPLVREAIQRALQELEAGGGHHRTMPPPGRGSWRPR